ncbi:hypothetical protein, partial [Aeromonas dhakensis]|uniref:hypothetical protein n=1 Tax=Aeromonas dhakensis TaxID=196024 RepID=UPI001E4DCC0B
KGAHHGKSNQLISPLTTAVGCNKRSAVHREHILIAVQFTSFFAPYSCCIFRVTNPPDGFVTSDERHASTVVQALDTRRRDF